MIRFRLPILLVMTGLGLLRASDLTTSVDAVMAHLPPGATASVVVIDTQTHAVLYGHDQDQPMSLASTTKLLIASAALLQLGPTYQFHTRLVGLGAIANGNLPDLGVIGGGSPCLDEHFAEDKDPDTFFRDWAQQLRNLGITHITGDVVIDNSLFSGPIRPSTYPSDVENQQRWFSAPASAFAWDDNCICVRLLPSASGRAATVDIRPRSPRIQVINQSHSTSTISHPIFSRELTSNTVIAAGTCSAPTSWFPLSIQSDPDLLNGDHLKAIITASGIPVDGTVRLGVIDPAHATLLIDSKQDLVPAVTLMNQHSQNFYGEQLLRLVAVARGQEGSISAGVRAVREVLSEHFGKDFANLALLDGCGLSYGNQASASTMAHLLDLMQTTPVAEAFISSLKERPSAGVRGRVKTGTLAIAICLVGYLDTKSGGRHAFAILLNKGDATGFAWAPKLRDLAYEAITEALP